jgi:calcium-translocating P-type ATPase
MVDPNENNQHPEGTRSVPWHALDVADVADRLQTHEQGLSQSEAQRRVDEYGQNTLEEEEGQSALELFLHQFRSPLIYILVVAAIATVFVQEYIDTAVIAAVLLLNAVIGFTQERKAEQSVMALRQLVAPKAHILRENRASEIESIDLVPGDVVLLESGTRVPADIRIFAATSLMADESLLTGESVPVQKKALPISEATAVADRTNILFAGTTISSGRGRGYVVETGDRTELGGIAEQVRTHETTQTPLQSRMDRFAKIVGAAVLGSTVVAFAIGFASGISASEMFMVGVGLAVAAVPEGLPIVFTVTMAIGVHRMAQRNAIIRRLPAVETLGSTTIIGSDKTGTLTENRMTVHQVWTPTESFDFSGHDQSSASEGQYASVHDTFLAGVLTNEATIYRSGGEIQVHGDPTEAALISVAEVVGIDPKHVRESYPVLSETPFEPDLRYSASLREIDGAPRLFVKGAPERLLDMSTSMYGEDGVEPLDRRRFEEAAEQMASRGLRVLATAVADVDSSEVPENGLPEPADLTFAGLFGLLDPPRQGVLEAIAGCQDAGIRVIMITGDHSSTASAIAADLGIANQNDGVMTGVELENFTDDELDEAVKDVAVFARVSPEHKLRIATACRRIGHVVGITGDGVNDAPALKAADIGIAMGKSGTDVAREASDMVLTDDNFVSIYGAVEQGRVTFDNVRKITFFLISTGIAATLTIITALVLQWPLPFLPAQLLWLNLVTNGLQDLALAFEPGEPDVLKRKPRRRDEGIISPLLWERSVIVGLIMSIGTLIMFSWELDRSDSLTQAQTVALTTMVIFQMLHVGNARSDYRSAFRISPFSNPFLLVATGTAFLVHVGAMYFPPAQFVLRIEPISFQAWVYIVLMALTIVAAVELHKLFRPRPTN